MRSSERNETEEKLKTALTYLGYLLTYNLNTRSNQNCHWLLDNELLTYYLNRLYGGRNKKKKKEEKKKTPTTLNPRTYKKDERGRTHKPPTYLGLFNQSVGQSVSPNDQATSA